MSAVPAAVHIKGDALVGFGFRAGQSFFSAEGYDRILFQPYSVCDSGISIALHPKGRDLRFLFGGHKVTPPSLYAEKEGVLGPHIKRNKPTEEKSPMGLTVGHVLDRWFIPFSAGNGYY